MKVLVAEDDAVQHVVLERTLNRFGHTPVVAEDGEQAWEAFTADADLRVVLTDIKKPFDTDELEARLAVAERILGLRVCPVWGSNSRRNSSDD